MNRKETGRRIGIADVAAKAAVSHATVSRVMNGNFTVDQQIAARVRKAADELKYHPSPVGRSLARGKTDTIGILVPDLANPSFQALLKSVSNTAARDGYRVLIADSSETPSEESILAGEARRHGDGVVLCAPRMGRSELEELTSSLQPMVLINRTDGAPSVSIDYRQGIHELAAHLYELGHRNIAFLSGPDSSASNAHRVRGLEEFCLSHPDVQLTTVPGGSSFDAGHRAAGDVLGLDITAVLAFNDLVAMGLLSGLHEQGVRVPDELSVTGFDDIPFAAYTTPSLTTAAVPIHDVGEQAWLRLRDLIRDVPAELQQPSNSIFKPRLQVRNSTGPAAATATDASVPAAHTKTGD